LIVTRSLTNTEQQWAEGGISARNT